MKTEDWIYESAPWKVNGIAVEDDNREVVCIVGELAHVDRGYEPCKGFPRTAPLLAAAPDLHRAVRALLNIVHDYLTHEEQANVESQIAHAKWALSKCRTMPHMHVNSGIKGDDSCKKCGHDLRHECHAEKS